MGLAFFLVGKISFSLEWIGLKFNIIIINTVFIKADQLALHILFCPLFLCSSLCANFSVYWVFKFFNLNSSCDFYLWWFKYMFAHSLTPFPSRDGFYGSFQDSGPSSAKLCNQYNTALVMVHKFLGWNYSQLTLPIATSRGRHLGPPPGALHAFLWYSLSVKCPFPSASRTSGSNVNYRLSTNKLS